MKYRLRLTYSVDGPARYASNLDYLRVWERAARRAGLVLLYSSGFNPRPHIQVAAALPVGFAGRAELLDLWLAQPADPDAAREGLAGALPAGLVIVRAELADPAEGPLPARVQAAEYTAEVETETPLDEVRRRVVELLAASSLPRQRRGRSYDLRPLVLQLRVEEGERVVLRRELDARQSATGRPEEVLDALGLAGGFFRVWRERLVIT